MSSNQPFKVLKKLHLESEKKLQFLFMKPQIPFTYPAASAYNQSVDNGKFWRDLEFHLNAKVRLNVPGAH